MNYSETASQLPALTPAGEARKHALESLAVDIEPTSVVGYRSAGKVLVIGPHSDVTKTTKRIEESGLKYHTLVTDFDTQKHDETGEFHINFQTDQYEMTGHLGAYQVISTADNRRFDLGLYAGLEGGKFDLVIEFAAQPTLPAEVPPPGYYWIGDDNGRDARIDEVLDEIPNLVGNFEKPKYFNYDPEICAHGRSGIVACTRCIDACPTQAISSLTEMIEVNSYLCQGAGTCATACPTGAITYAYPPAENLQEILRQLISNYCQSGGTHPSVVFYDKENGAPFLEQIIHNIDETRLPVQVEEVGSVGLDVCLSALAYGASNLKIILSDATPEQVRQELVAQFEVLEALLANLGYPRGIVELLETPFSTERINDNSATITTETSASYAATGVKRTDIRTALEHLHEHAPEQPKIANLPTQAPFGTIYVDTETCTLCMGCVSVCPAAALESGDDSPKLSFIEQNCVQCGLCETACPENSITREPRYLFTTDERMRSRTLNEDAPFHCRLCGKPFATNAMLNKMRDKLKGHWMFENNSEAMMRLEMCEDCRVKDMFAAEGGFPRDKL